MCTRRLFIYCAGGLGRDVLKMSRYMEDRNPRWNNIIFVDDYCKDNTMNGALVWSFEKYLQEKNVVGDEFVIANGEGVYRRELAQKLDNYSCHLTTLIHPGVTLDAYDEIKGGSIITEGNIMGGSIKTGRCTYISLACVLGHDVELGDFVTLSHDVNLSGNVHIGDGTYIGTGAIIRDEVSVGKNCIIGMGSLVTRDIPDNVVAYGSPCKVIRENVDGIVFG